MFGLELETDHFSPCISLFRRGSCVTAPEKRPSARN